MKQDLSEQEMTNVLTYAGFILVAYELAKSLIVSPIKSFYKDMTFGEGLPFVSYEHDVLTRSKSEFEACLFYLRDFMEAIDSDDVQTIQDLRKHRNDLAHNLPEILHSFDPASYSSLLERSDAALFKLSNYRLFQEIGMDPEYKDSGINWDTAEGHEYGLFKEVISKLKPLQPLLPTSIIPNE